MFGMLDYRAHKLYILLFGIPLFILNWIYILGIPFASYAIAKNYADSWWGIFLFSVLAYLVLQIAGTILGLIIGKFIEFAFTLVVDVIPADGRTKEEAKLVTWGGEKTIAILELGHTTPNDWTDEQIESVTKGFFNWFYKDSIIKRLDFIREFQRENPEFVSNNYNNERLLGNNKLAIPISEQIVCNQIYRGWVIGGLLFLFLLLVQPTL
jgi:hypothetical protein